MKFINTRCFLVLLFLLFSNQIFSQAPVANFTIDDASGCAPHFARFTSTTTGSQPISYSWDFGDGTGGSVIDTPSHNFALPGQYTVTLTATNSSGSSTHSATVTVFKNPEAKYFLDKDTVCPGVPILFTDSSELGDAPITSWLWQWNDGNPPDSLVSSVFHTFANPSSQVNVYRPILTVRDANGCNSTFDSISVYVFPTPVASFGIGAGSSCTIPAVINFTNSSSGQSNYTWNFGDPSSGVNNTSTLTTPSHIYNAQGSYLVTLTNGVPGCSDEDTMTIHITPPVAAFTTSDSIICRRDTVFFNAAPSAGSYQWDFDDFSPIGFGQNQSHAYINPGTYVVVLTVTLGTCVSTAQDTVVVPPSPSVQFSSPDNTACNVPFTVTFNADPTPNNVAWEWNFGDPGSGTSNTSNLRNPTHTYNSFGSYDVSLKVTDIYGCTDSVMLFSFVRIQPPVADFINTDSGCVDKIFNFNSTSFSQFDPITNYTWDFGDGSGPVSTTNPGTTHQYSAPGIYDVTLIITTGQGCSDTITQTEFIRVGTPPVATIDSTQSVICFKDNVQFNDATPQPVTGWHWFFEDGGSSFAQNPNHQFNIITSPPGNPFDVVLIAYYNGCSDTDTVVNMVTVQLPIPDFDTAYNCVNPNSVDFTNLSVGGDSLFWNFGDGSPIVVDVQNPTHVFPGPGTYNVVLTAMNILSGCYVDTTYEVQITNLTAVATSDVIVACHPGQVNFSSSTSQDVLAQQWTFGEGIPNVFDTSFVQNPTHVYNTPGNYVATLTTTDIHSCVKTDTIGITIIGPLADFTADKLGGCNNVTINFTDASTPFGSPITQWVWNFGTGPNETLAVNTVAHTFASVGLYDISLTVTDVNGCTHTTTKFDYINVSNPSASIFYPDTGCANAQELLIGNAGVAAAPVTYRWYFGDGQTQTIVNNNLATHVYAANGNYTVSLAVEDANGCIDSATKDIYIFTTDADFSITATDTCVNQGGIKKAQVIASFHSNSNTYVTNWDWDLSVKRDSIWSSPNYFHSYLEAPGTYDVTLIVTNKFGCRDTSIQPGAIVVPGPTGSFSFVPDSGCSPLTVNFTGSSTNASLYAWDFGDGTVINGTTDSIVSHTYYTPNVYTPQFFLGFQLSNSFCYVQVPDAGNVTVTSLIGVNIVEDSIFVTLGERDTLTVVVNDPIGNPPYTYNWTPAGQVINGPTTGTFLATTTGQDQYYYVSVPYGTQGCSGTDSVLVRYRPCDALDSIPNVFTPNDGNQMNNTYHIKNLCDFDGFYIKIFNRWGRVVFESSKANFQWDGTLNDGTEASDGVYYYVLNAKAKALHGWIELIRARR